MRGGANSFCTITAGDRTKKPGHVPPGHLPQGHIPPGHLPPGHLPPGHLPPRTHTTWSLTPGNLHPGHVPPRIYIPPRTYTPYILKCPIWFMHHVLITYCKLKSIYFAGIAFVCDAGAIMLSDICSVRKG